MTRRRLVLFALLAGLTLAGCKKRPEPEPEPEKPAGNPVKLRIDSQHRLRQLHLAYQAAAIGEQVRGPSSLGPGMQMSDPWGKPYEVVWGVDFQRSAGLGDSRKLLAWESVPDPIGGRNVLWLNGEVEYLNEAVFQQAPRATPPGATRKK